MDRIFLQAGQQDAFSRYMGNVSMNDKAEKIICCLFIFAKTGRNIQHCIDGLTTKRNVQSLKCLLNMVTEPGRMAKIALKGYIEKLAEENIKSVLTVSFSPAKGLRLSSRSFSTSSFGSIPSSLVMSRSSVP